MSSKFITLLCIAITFFSVPTGQLIAQAAPLNPLPNNALVITEIVAATPSAAIVAQESPSILSLENEFIKIIVNNQEKDTGRFSVETTLGDPLNPLDDNNLLIFGRPTPWTSYTSLLIDKSPFVFGGLDTRVEKRGGKPQAFGQVIKQSILADGIETVTLFDHIEVSQTLSFFRNPSTKIKDAILISYTITNKDTQPHDVGLRIMLDTKLGKNDGAPLRIGDQAVTSEKLFANDDVLDFWQTFDQVTSPNIIAQGTLSFEPANIKKPNRMILANWGTLVDHPWTIAYEPGRSFVRVGELEKDTALAMYWDPVSIAPSASVTHKTIYGLGGISLTPGELSVGITAPAEVPGSQKKPILLIAYVQNTSGFDARDTILTFSLPKGFEIVSGKKRTELGTLKPGETRQIPLQVKLNNPPAGTHKIQLDVDSSTLESNRAIRLIDVIAPPAVNATLQLKRPTSVKALSFVDAILTVKNPTSFILQDIDVAISSRTKDLLPYYEIPKKTIARLAPNQVQTINWKLKNPASQDLAIAVNITSPVIKSKKIAASIKGIAAQSTVKLRVSRPYIKAGDYFYVSLDLTNPDQIEDDVFSMYFDPNKVKFIRWSPAKWVIPFSGKNSASLTESSFSFPTLAHPGNLPFLEIGKVHFKALATGNSDFMVKNYANDTASKTVIINKQEKAGIQNDPY